MNTSPHTSVLFPVWEIEPYLKVGGLGEVARSLPRALKTLGVDIRVVIPRYKALKLHRKREQQLGILKLRFGARNLFVTVSMITFLNNDIPIYLLSNATYFDKPIPETFAVFAGAVAELLSSSIMQGWQPDVVHCNDNHCGLIPVLLKEKKYPVRTLLTIHCITHQRKSPLKFALDVGISPENLHPAMWETKQKQLNFLVEGIEHADLVTTVSPTYLKEIQTEKFGAGIDDVMRQHAGKTSAILNGIDYELKNPATNQFLQCKFSSEPTSDHHLIELKNPVEARMINKSALQLKVGLPVDANVTVIGFVGRLDASQKGIDVLHRMLWREQFDNCQFVIMGHGEEDWEERFTTLSTFLPNRVAVRTVYDERLASLLYAGSDFILIPSHFEPCCLIQMNAMRYGAIPIARATGGLNDTVQDGVNGFLYAEPTSHALHMALQRALDVKNNAPGKYRQMMWDALQTDFSWTKSAQEYLTLYKRLQSLPNV